MESLIDSLILLVVVIVSAVLYLIPWEIALARKHHNTKAIFAVNLLLGWMVLGWIAALVWALTKVESGPE